MNIRIVDSRRDFFAKLAGGPVFTPLHRISNYRSIQKVFPHISLMARQKMNSRTDDTRTNVFAKLVAALFLVVGIICSAYAAIPLHIDVSSGAADACFPKGFYRVDANGKEWPVTIEYTDRPKHGTATTKVSSAIVSVRGQVKTVRLTQVIYQSKAGYGGYDSFTFRRVTADPTDTNSGKEYTVAVTVR